MHNSLCYLSLLPLLLLMYVSFQLTPPCASSQTHEGLIPLLFLGSFYVADDCACLYNHQSHIFYYFYMFVRDDCFPSIENSFLLMIYIFLFGSITLAYPVIMLTENTFRVFLVFFIIFICTKQCCIANILLVRYMDFLETMDCLHCYHLKFCFLNNEYSNCFYIFISSLLVNPTFVSC